MCGAANGVLGFDKTTVINKTIFGNDSRFEIADNDQEMINGVVLNIDDDTKKAKEIFLVKAFGEENGK